MPVIMNKSAIYASAAFVCASASNSDVTAVEEFINSVTGLRVFDPPAAKTCADFKTWSDCFAPDNLNPQTALWKCHWEDGACKDGNVDPVAGVFQMPLYNATAGWTAMGTWTAGPYKETAAEVDAKFEH